MVETETEAPLSIVEEAKRLRDEIRAENDRREKILADEQKLQAEKLLGSSAGAHIPPTAPPVESAKDYANRVMKGEIKAK